MDDDDDDAQAGSNRRKTLAQRLVSEGRRAPITCLSIFDSMLIHAYVDGSTCAFDVSPTEQQATPEPSPQKPSGDSNFVVATNQSFFLTDSEPRPFFPPLDDENLRHIDEHLVCARSTGEVEQHLSSSAPQRGQVGQNDDAVEREEVLGRGEHDLGSGAEASRGLGLKEAGPVSMRVAGDITSRVTEPSVSPHSRKVQERDYLTAEEFASLSAGRLQPMLLKKEMENWGALRSWSFDMFSEGYIGQTKVQVTGKAGVKTEMHLVDYISSFRNEKAEDVGYLRGWTYEKDCELLKADVQIPGFAYDWFQKLPKKDDPFFRWIFLGPRGSKTPIHVDPCLTHAWLGQVVGMKRFILYPPSDLIHLYDDKGRTVDIRTPDRHAFPSFDAAQPWEVVLCPGDMLVVPAGWAHQVECVSDSISVTHNWLPKENFSAVRACLLANRLGKAVTRQ